MATEKTWDLWAIVGDWLETHDYDGLCIPPGEVDEDGCGCRIGDLCPCDEPDWTHCHPAYAYKKGGYGVDKSERKFKNGD